MCVCVCVCVCVYSTAPADRARRALHYVSCNRHIPLTECSTPPGGGVYILSSSDRLFRCITTLQCG